MIKKIGDDKVLAAIGAIGVGVAVGLIFVFCADDEVKAELNSQVKEILKTSRKMIDVISSKAEKAYKENVHVQESEASIEEQWESVLNAANQASEN